jgi:aminopeptidase-like protein
MTMSEDADIGGELHRLAQRLWPIGRSLTGHGVRASLAILKEYLPALTVHEVPSGTTCFDWTVPREWNIRAAWIVGPDGNKVVDFADNNLHVVGYSTPVRATLSLAELAPHLYSLPEQPDAIPYITSYYKERWGFCLAHRQKEALPEGQYRVHIDSELTDGSLTYGELLIPGETADEVFLSTYVCHPSMANNELSGPCVATYLARWLGTLPRRRYSYRVVFIPETIGSIVYLSRHLAELRARVKAGFVLTCIGDDRTYSYLESRLGNTLADQAARHALRHHYPEFKHYSFLHRGSDERQYGSPGVDLPVASIMRSKYGTYPEYHTSLDNLELVTPSGLNGGFHAVRRALQAIEMNCLPCATIQCEPQLGKRGLYPTLSTKATGAQVKNMMNLLAYADGEHSLLAIAEKIEVPIWELRLLFDSLAAHGLLKSVDA